MRTSFLLVLALVCLMPASASAVEVGDASGVRMDPDNAHGIDPDGQPDGKVSVRGAIEELANRNTEDMQTGCLTEDHTLLADGLGGWKPGCGPGGGGGGSSITLDLGNDGDDSTGVLEIITSGDLNGVFSEPSADQLFIDLSQPVPAADAATNLTGAGGTATMNAAGFLTVGSDRVPVQSGTGALQSGEYTCTIPGTTKIGSGTDCAGAAIAGVVPMTEAELGTFVTDTLPTVFAIDDGDGNITDEVQAAIATCVPGTTDTCVVEIEAGNFLLDAPLVIGETQRHWESGSDGSVRRFGVTLRGQGAGIYVLGSGVYTPFGGTTLTWSGCTTDAGANGADVGECTKSYAGGPNESAMIWIGGGVRVAVEDLMLLGTDDASPTGEQQADVGIWISADVHEGNGSNAQMLTVQRVNIVDVAGDGIKVMGYDADGLPAGAGAGDPWGKQVCIDAPATVGCANGPSDQIDMVTLSQVVIDAVGGNGVTWAGSSGWNVVRDSFIRYFDGVAVDVLRGHITVQNVASETSLAACTGGAFVRWWDRDYEASSTYADAGPSGPNIVENSRWEAGCTQTGVSTADDMHGFITYDRTIWDERECTGGGACDASTQLCVGGTRAGEGCDVGFNEQWGANVAIRDNFGFWHRGDTGETSNELIGFRHGGALVVEGNQLNASSGAGQMQVSIDNEVPSRMLDLSMSANKFNTASGATKVSIDPDGQHNISGFAYYEDDFAPRAWEFSPKHRLVDTDGDGLTDYARVEGDWNGDGVLNPKDIQLAVDALTDTGKKVVSVGAGDYAMENGYANITAWKADTAVTDWAGVLLPSNTTLQCDPGARLLGWTDPDDYDAADGVSGFAMVRSAGSGPTSSAVEDIDIIGCHIDLQAFAAPYDDVGQSSSVVIGIYIAHCEGCDVLGNTVKNTHHTCIYYRSSKIGLIADNLIDTCGYFESTAVTKDDTLAANASAGDTTVTVQAGEGVAGGVGDGDRIVIELDDGSWWSADVLSRASDTYTLHHTSALPSAATAGNRVARTTTSQTGNPAAGVYLFNEGYDDVPYHTEDIVVERNRLFRQPSVALHSRANEETGASEQGIIRNVVFRDNYVFDGGYCFDIRSVSGGLYESNECVRTAGFDLSAQGSVYCNEDAETGTAGFQRTANCSENIVVRNNVARQNMKSASGPSGAGIGSYVDNILLQSNVIDGSVNQSCIINSGNVRGLKIKDLTLRNCDESGWEDFNSSAGLKGVRIDGLTIEDWGREAYTSNINYGLAFSLAPGHEDWRVTGLRTSGAAGNAVRIETTFNGFELRDFDIDGTRHGYLGNFTEAGAQAAYPTCDNNHRNRWLVVTDASGASDCDFSATTGATSVRCGCDGASWAALSESGFEGIRLQAGSGETIQNWRVADGDIHDIHNDSGVDLTDQGGTLTLGAFENVRFFNRDDSTTITMVRGIIAPASLTGTMDDIDIINVECLEGTGATCVEGLDEATTGTAYWGGSTFYRATETPVAGACSADASGAIYIDTNGAAGSQMYVCDGTTWNAL